MWNPDFRFASPFDFLTFAPQKKRIALSPSFGVSKIPNQYTAQYTTWLNEMHALSVREEAGAKIIKELTGRDADVLVDPTMLLSKEEWLNIARPSAGKPSKTYLLTYLLGEVGVERKKWISNLSKKYDLEVINLLDTKNEPIYITDPSEFIDFIHSASIVCTDSFHGVIFSIIMETPFIVFDREERKQSKMGSRIETLLKKMQFENRYYKMNQSIEAVLDINFAHTKDIILNEQDKLL